MYRVGIIGCGKPWRSEGATGFGMSHQHAEGYKASPDARIVALADISEENARAFQERHGGDTIYTDYRAMLEQERLDIVSISTWPHLHAPMVIACAEAGVRAVHCEKPMALTYGDSLAMVEICERNGVQLTFNHQRRFGAPFRAAKALLQEGAIGALERMEATCGNLYDWGTHWFDMLLFFNDETPAEWVIGQVDLRGSQRVFGAPVEGHGLSHFRCRNGVHGVLMTGHGAYHPLLIRLVGSDGVIELGHNNEVPLRVWGRGQSGWQGVPLNEGLHGGECTRRGVLDLIAALKEGREPELSGRRALRATELIFATYESSRRRARVDLPLDVTDSPLQALLDEAGVTPV
ncbi:MAG TPA: Gfo/Idh/MocA family oxidoreductase [Roseiflexaceae bacterium]|nr:Gfo/Idh/MocA family oxidoreductase [Roseiflexaceae bacterium]